MNKGTSLRSSERDTALDVLRAMALLMMVSVHFARAVEDHTAPAGLLKFFLGAAPAFFFFAFGMTLPRFFFKSGSVQFRLSRLFLYIAVLQTFMMDAPFSIDFFLFLWFWQVALTLLDRYGSMPTKGIAACIGMVLVLLFAFPHPWMSRIFALWGGYFPLLPWGLFVLAGILFARTARSRKVLLFSLLLIAGSALLAAAGRHYEVPRLAAEKIPMTATYFLLFTGIVLGVYGLAKRGEGRIRQFPRMLATLRFFSKNLLLGTVLHYFAYRAFKMVVLILQRFDPQGWGAFVKRWDVVAILVGALGSCVLLGVLLKIALVLFDRWKDAGLLMRMRRRLDWIALPAMGLVTVLFFLSVSIKNGQPVLGFTLPASLAEIPKHAIKTVALGFMVYLCLEMRLERKGAERKTAA